MKPKYKLDNFIRYTDIEGGEKSGVISAVITRNVGFSYFVENDPVNEIPEYNVLQSYKPIVKRSKKRRQLEMPMKEKKAS